jgi:hypothetical protein
MSDIGAKDAMVADAAEAQRKKGLLPDVRAAEDYLSSIMQRLDRKQSEAKPRPVRVDKSDRAEKKMAEAEKRARRAGFELMSGWEFDEKRPLALGGSALEVKREGKLTKLLRARIRMLQGYPEWQDRFKRINPFALNGQAGKNPDERQQRQLEATELVRQIIRDSNVVFGDWWKPAPKKLWQSGQSKRG